MLPCYASSAAMPQLLDARNGEAFDLPVSARPPRTWVLASVPRSGSTLLCRLLWDAHGVGAPKEYLNPMQVRDWEVRLSSSSLRRFAYGALRGPAVGLARGRGWDRARLVEHVRRVRERRTDPSGWFGVKLHYHHFESWFLERGWSVDEILAPARWIRIVRHDRLAQAVSWARALQTGRWASHQRGYLPPLYRPTQIRRRLAEIERQEAGWDDFFAQRGIEPLEVSYEELVANRVGTVRAILTHLDVPGAEVAPIPEPDLDRQSDALNARWIERYRAAYVRSGLEEEGL